MIILVSMELKIQSLFNFMNSEVLFFIIFSFFLFTFHIKFIFYKENMGSSKSLSNFKVLNFIPDFNGIKVETTIRDEPRRVSKYNFCQSRPKVRKDVKLMGLSKAIIQEMGLDYQEVKKDPETAEYLAGNKLLPNSIPICNNYCGFQFGVWAGQLGDGRAHTLGQYINQNIVYELQLKGSGKTPFSRHADGNSVVSSALRQFLASELLYGLQVPTTRAASLVVADENVIRDPFYNGQLKVQNAAVVLRICESFLRFGSMQVCLKEANMTESNPLNNRKTLLPLLDYLLKYCYPSISEDQGDPYEQMYKIITEKTSQLVAYWQANGFVHGVLNTDNMSMVSKTIDYGPFAFIDYFSKDYVSNATDEHQRYSYRRQPFIVRWNLERLAQAMDPIVPASVLKKHLDQNFDKFYSTKYYQLMHEKLGLHSSTKPKQIIDQLFEVMDICSSHFTNVFRILETHLSEENQLIDKQVILQQLLQESCPTEFYLKNLKSYPKLVGRPYDHILEYDSGFNIFFLKQQEKRVQMYSMLANQNCNQRRDREKFVWAKWLDSYLALKPKINLNSCPKYVLLNQIAKKINAELLTMKNSKDQVEYLEKVLKVFYKPYEKNEWFEEKFWKLRPTPVKLTCSS